jgi:POT family proton-dependent oligopeptide transporter
MVYGIFSGFATFLPLIGGIVADRWNYQTPLTLGAVVNALGCFLLSTGIHALLYPALFIISCGYGLFTPSILTVLGHIYKEKPHLREAGFSIYYASINLGVFLALISLGFIAQQISWNAAFFTAGVVQVIGLFPIFWYLHKHKETHRALHKEQLLQRDIKTPLSKIGRDRAVVIFAACFFSIVFWIAYNQGFSSLSLFAKDYTDRMVLGWEIPSSWLLSSESFGLILLGPLLAILYKYLQKKRLDPSPMAKTALSLVFIAICFGIMMWASFSIPSDAESAAVSPFFLLSAFLFMAVGEMLLAPIGLSLVTQLAPRHKTAFYVGVWYFCVGFAFYIGGVLASFMERVGGLFHFFSIFVIITLIPAAILFFFSSKLTRMSHRHVDTPPPNEVGI